MEEKTTQLWPSGNSVRYSVTDKGEYHLHESSKPCTIIDIKVEERARMYIDQMIWHCDSYLVSKLFELNANHNNPEGFSIEDIENQYTDVSEMDRDELLAFISDYSNVNDYKDEEDEEVIREAANAIANENPHEVFEWYRVDPWLCNRLAEIGQPVIRNDYGD